MQMQQSLPFFHPQTRFKMHQIKLPAIRWHIAYFGAFGEDRECEVEAPTRRKAVLQFTSQYFPDDHITRIEALPARPSGVSRAKRHSPKGQNTIL